MTGSAGSAATPSAGGQANGAASSHRALLYRDGQDVRAADSFLQAAIAVREPVLAVLPPEKLARLRPWTGQDLPDVELIDAAAFFRRHGAATRALSNWIRAHARSGRRARVLTEPPLALAAPHAVRAYLQIEAAANLVYQPYPVFMLCLYDTAALPRQVLTEAERTHPELAHGEEYTASARYDDPREYVRNSAAVVQPPASAPSIPVSHGDLADVRRFTRAQAAAAGLDDESIQELLIAAGELAANALGHGAPPSQLWIYTESDLLICHFLDHGTGFGDPLAAHLIPEPGAPHGQGLWIARQLCDYLDAATDHTGTHIRLGYILPSHRNAY